MTYDGVKLFLDKKNNSLNNFEPGIIKTGSGWTRMNPKTEIAYKAVVFVVSYWVGF